MGNKQYTKDQVDLVSSHPTFKAAKVITENDQRRITAIVPSDDEGYNTWKKLLSKHEKELAKSEFLLLAKKHTFSKQGLCSNTGNVTVTNIIYSRSITNTTLTCCPNKSQIDTKNNKDSDNPIFGTCFTAL